MFFYGYRRFTENVDILVTSDGLKDIHCKLEDLCYLLPHSPGGKQFRDIDYGVRNKFLTSGDYPGGQSGPKSVAYPDPKAASFDIGGVHVLQLPCLIELKLAYGMSSPGRLGAVADVQRMIEVLGLLAGLTDQLNPCVREKYTALWTAVRDNPSEE